MFQSLCEERIDELTGHFFVVARLNLFGFRLLQSRNLIDRDTMIEKHLHTVCAPHKRDLIALSDGRVNEDVVFIFLNTVGNRFKRSLYYIKAGGFSHTSEFVSSTT